MSFVHLPEALIHQTLIFSSWRDDGETKLCAFNLMNLQLGFTYKYSGGFTGFFFDCSRDVRAKCKELFCRDVKSLESWRMQGTLLVRILWFFWWNFFLWLHAIVWTLTTLIFSRGTLLYLLSKNVVVLLACLHYKLLNQESFGFEHLVVCSPS